MAFGDVLAEYATRDRLIDELNAEDELALGANANSLDFLRAVYSSPTQPMHRRMRAAIAALPFETPKLAVIASMDAPANFAAKLEAAILRSSRGGGLRLISGPGPEPADGGVADAEGSRDLG